MLCFVISNSVTSLKSPPLFPGYPDNSHTNLFQTKYYNAVFLIVFFYPLHFILLFSVFPFLPFSYTPVITVSIVSLSQMYGCLSHTADFLMVAFLVSVRFYLLFLNVSPVVTRLVSTPPLTTSIMNINKKHVSSFSPLYHFLASWEKQAFCVCTCCCVLLPPLHSAVWLEFNSSRK